MTLKTKKLICFIVSMCIFVTCFSGCATSSWSEVNDSLKNKPTDAASKTPILVPTSTESPENKEKSDSSEETGAQTEKNTSKPEAGEGEGQNGSNENTSKATTAATATPTATENSKQTASPTETTIAAASATAKATEAPAKATATATPANVQYTKETIKFNADWVYGDMAVIKSGTSTLYKATENRKNIVVAVNAGHGTEGGSEVKTYCHPDMSPKITGGSTSAGSLKATAVAEGMEFTDGTAEKTVTLKTANYLKDLLLENGYDVLMIRDGEDVQLDNVARTVMANNIADCHISLHWDGDEKSYDKGCFYISVPEGLKSMVPVKNVWQESEALGRALVNGLKSSGKKIFGDGTMEIDLTQTAYSEIPSVDIELGNQCSDISEASLKKAASGLYNGINNYFG